MSFTNRDLILILAQKPVSRICEAFLFFCRFFYGQHTASWPEQAFWLTCALVCIVLDLSHYQMSHRSQPPSRQMFHRQVSNRIRKHVSVDYLEAEIVYFFWTARGLFQTQACPWRYRLPSHLSIFFLTHLILSNLQE